MSKQDAGSTLDTNRLSDPAVKAAFESWQSGDLEGWLSHFTADAELYDDGAARDFQGFSREIGKERFTSIESVGKGGLEVVGNFHSDTWGDFKTFFRFRRDASGKFDRLDIGQAK